MTERRLSRWMPPAPETKPSNSATFAAFAVLAAMVLALLGIAWKIEGGSFAVGFLMGVTVIAGVTRSRRMRRMAADRAGEGICTFARSFGRRGVDPWVIRAVYEELRPYADPAPIRATDRLDRDLGVVDEELDDVARDAAARAGRSLRDPERNPVRRVETVGDLVLFLAHQPRAADA